MEAGAIRQPRKESNGNGRRAGEPARGRKYETVRALKRRRMVYNVDP